MTILLVLIPLGIVLLGLAIALFVWAARNGQFEDLDGEGARILFEDLPRPAARAGRIGGDAGAPAQSEVG